MKRVLVTGGAGFIAHHVIATLLDETDCEIVSLDRLDTSGTLCRLQEIVAERPESSRRLRSVWHDLKAPLNDLTHSRIGTVDTVLHLAAGTHVDRSIEYPLEFVHDNVVGTAHLLEYVRAKQPDLEKMVYFSTDEVFGPAPVGVAYKEDDRYRSGNPYAAAKAGAEELCVAWHNTYKVPVICTHTMNVFGIRQHPEKFIPLSIRKIRDGGTITVHADPTRTKAGSRFYIHTSDVASGLRFILERGQVGEKYNLVGERETDNLALITMIGQIMGRSVNYDMVDFHSARPGHDLRYALDGGKLAKMGWRPLKSLHDRLEETVNWSLEHPHWLGDAR